jgi:hypothetical protein
VNVADTPINVSLPVAVYRVNENDLEPRLTSMALCTDFNGAYSFAQEPFGCGIGRWKLR